MEPKQQRYSFKDAITTAAMTKFASGILDGSVKPEVKSAEIPAEATEDGVTVVVGKSFDAVCKDEAKDVLLEVYAPWCGHCRVRTPSLFACACVSSASNNLQEPFVHACIDTSDFDLVPFVN